MTSPAAPPSTGLPGLDQVLQGLRPGDNVVWQVEAVDDYRPLVAPFVARAVAEGRRVVYFRFARHAPLVEPAAGVTVHQLSPALGFESFTAAIHAAIEEAGPGTFHVFDCLSDLAAGWYSDLMLGNFFMVTCPYLYELETVTYFALLRESHSSEAVDAIRETTQLLVDVFRHRRETYLHPLKVDGRHSPTMYLPHAWTGGAFRALTESAELSEALSEVAERRADAVGRPDVWERRVLAAREVRDGVRAGRRRPEEERDAFQQLLGMLLTRDERFAALASQHLLLDDLLAIRRRMVGTGLVGGKAAGMLVARAVLVNADPAWARLLEPHDSWFIGSDVFYTYLVRSGCWRARRDQRRSASFLAGAEEARRRVLEGRFPDFVLRQFVALLEYYGQSPIVVRSSSLLEDGYGNAFTGKYESVFCANQGSPAERLRDFVAAVQAVYASAMSEEALRYRERRGLLDRDEQMAVLVQRVSGAVRGGLYFPQVAGVALSYNPYVWNVRIDPQAGVVRLVFGLGTRAVDRADDDYTRIVALNAPTLRPESGLDELTEYAQHRVDVLDLEQRRLVSLRLDEVLARAPGLPMALFGTPRGQGWVLTFDQLLWSTPLVERLRELLVRLRDAYRCPVDVEFTGNFVGEGELRLNLVQCRPLQVREGGAVLPAPTGLAEQDVLLRSRGPMVGPSAHTPIDRVVYVDPDAYAQLGTGDRHEVGRVIGRLTALDRAGLLKVLLLGPGRWGTTTPALGVPVSFAEIQRVSVLCEVMRLGDVVPDVSLGSHFFNDLVEEDMLYLAIFPTLPGHALAEATLRAAPNRLPALLPDDARLAGVVRVVDFPAHGEGTLWLNADCVRQEAVCYRVPG
ncbi:MAG: pyruvate, phosphate dikinase [Anaeromyxobacter sp.]|nr:pyruvate, phosphate dikinase [Anaeromyxobacter sp.]MBL0276218.1 pyruvate, phosphate dikinase [Anaeromyxobacter sp.]